MRGKNATRKVRCFFVDKSSLKAINGIACHYKTETNLNSVRFVVKIIILKWYLAHSIKGGRKRLNAKKEGSAWGN